MSAYIEQLPIYRRGMFIFACRNIFCSADDTTTYQMWAKYSVTSHIYIGINTTIMLMLYCLNATPRILFD